MSVPTPKSLRDFGYIPNTQDWLPGDIILFSQTDPDLIGRSIQQVQEQCGYPASDARWQHAAIYVGRHHLCEAVWPRIRFHPIFDRIGSSLIRVRRLPDLLPDERYEVALAALTKISQPYGWREILEILRRRTFPSANPSVPPRPPSLICSQLCVSAYAKALGIVLTTDGIDRATTPADLSQSLSLTDVPLFWQKIEQT